MTTLRNTAAWVKHTGESPRWLLVLLLAAGPSALLGWLVVLIVGALG